MKLDESGRLLLQRVDADLVFMDTTTGAEATRPHTIETLMHTIDDVATARIEDTGLVEIDDVVIPESSFDQLLYGLGYFAKGAVS